MTWDSESKLAERAVRAGAQRLRDLARAERKVLSAQGRDIKLQADKDAESAILSILDAAGLPILSEESGEHGVVAGTPAWIVDPLDGSLNFQRGIPLCCVSVALWRDDEPLLGVVFDFHRDEFFAGTAGEGATLNGAPIRVSSVDRQDQAVLATGFPSGRAYDDASLNHFIGGLRCFKKVRLLGSAALSLAYVACGRFDAYAEEDILLWDVAAGLALVRAAGGLARVAPSSRLKWGRDVVAGASERIISF